MAMVLRMEMVKPKPMRTSDVLYWLTCGIDVHELFTLFLVDI